MLRAHAAGVEEGGSLADIVPEAWRFLLEQACINLGIPSGEPPRPAPVEDAGPSEEEALVAAVFKLLKGVDLESTTEKMIRKQLEEQLGVDLSQRKAFIREQACLSHVLGLPIKSTALWEASLTLSY